MSMFVSVFFSGERNSVYLWCSVANLLGQLEIKSFKLSG